MDSYTDSNHKGLIQSKWHTSIIAAICSRRAGFSGWSNVMSESQSPICWLKKQPHNKHHCLLKPFRIGSRFWCVGISLLQGLIQSLQCGLCTTHSPKQRACIGQVRTRATNTARRKHLRSDLTQLASHSAVQTRLLEYERRKQFSLLWEKRDSFNNPVSRMIRIQEIPLKTYILSLWL